jgi:hypothetical protein
MDTLNNMRRMRQVFGTCNEIVSDRNCGVD